METNCCRYLTQILDISSKVNFSQNNERMN